MNEYEKSLGHWVKRFYLLSSREVDVALRPYDLGRTQWYILFHVDKAGELPQRALQTILEIESATLTPLVSALVRKGWLEQIPSLDDRRTKNLALTASGARHFRSVPNPIVQARKKAFAGLDARDVENARRVIEQAVHNLEK
ncbi:MAG: MarR family transcriptional regulator [Gammaproteobacteria bacterium]|nr:MarR family transcriptional regulator [Gammaproteobacteria bacterium]